ncbi:ribonuclease HI [Piscirickettsia litoralis]|uniref:Ribonuclease H n=1 Tax=Piscirickettsia litoralis TaxID=1891921 RepID=A0ABX3A3T7_9GAMM|nr:ribonuclease HI [Piscirickettsia litoralis]
MIDIYTDGGCRGNPGPGGWGAVIVNNQSETELSGFEDHTTNNRMELTAAIKALEALPSGTQARLTTDSNYVKQGINQWVHNWKKNGWKTSQKKDVLNKDLWQQLDQLNENLNIEWHWVKGHSGHPYNERCDELANLAMDQLSENVSHPQARPAMGPNNTQGVVVSSISLEERLERVENKLDIILQRLSELS